MVLAYMSWRVRSVKKRSDSQRECLLSEETAVQTVLIYKAAVQAWANIAPSSTGVDCGSLMVLDACALETGFHAPPSFAEKTRSSFANLTSPYEHDLT
jgi:hypothetical protein